jgi:hypothetical protein
VYLAETNHWQKMQISAAASLTAAGFANIRQAAVTSRVVTVGWQFRRHFSVLSRHKNCQSVAVPVFPAVHIGGKLA